MMDGLGVDIGAAAAVRPASGGGKWKEAEEKRAINVLENANVTAEGKPAFSLTFFKGKIDLCRILWDRENILS